MRRTFLRAAARTLLLLASGLSCGEAPTAPPGLDGGVAGYVNPGGSEVTPSFRVVTTNPVAGQALTVDASASVSPTEMVSFAWQWGDGTSVTTRSTPTGGVHTYAAAGSYQVTLTVCDRFSTCRATSQAVSIGGDLTGIDFTAPPSLYAYADVSLSVLGPADPGGNPARYAWQFVNESIVLSDSGRTVSPLFTAAGTYVVTIRAQLPGAPGMTLLRTLYVGANERPTQPTLSCAPVSVAMNATVACTAAASSDPDGGAITWEWSESGRQSATTTTATYAWPTSGTYEIRVHTRDSRNARSLPALATVSVMANQPPTVPTLSCSPTSVLLNQVVTCTASGSTDPEGSAVTYAFSPTGRTSVNGATATYAWGTSGTYEVSVTASDPSGLASAATARSITAAANQPPTTPTLSCAPTTALPNQTISCTASGSTDPEGGAVTYAFSADGKQSSSGSTATYAWGATGAYTISVTASDASGATSAAASRPVNVANQPPTTPALSCSPTTPLMNQTVTCTASGSTDPEGQGVTYTFSADGRTSVSGGTATYAWGTAGTRTVTATASDALGATSAAASQAITVAANQPPTVPTLSCAPTTVQPNQTISCTASGSTDPEGGAVTYVFSADGKQSSSGGSATYAWGGTGSYTISVTASDAAGASSAAASRAVNVANQPPSTPALSCSPTTPLLNQVVTCTASGSSDPEGQAVTYAFSTDGRTSVSGGTATYAWGTSGTRTITATASDPFGATSAAASQAITVAANQPPTTPALSCAPTTVLPNQVISCTASGSSDPEGGAVTYAFSVDGRQSASGTTATYAWGGIGSYTISVTASDASGATSAAASRAVNVANQPPSTPALSCAPTAPLMGQVVTCTASGSSDPEGQGVTYAFSPDGRQSMSGATATYAWGTSGTRTVTATASDPLGATSAAASQTITVAANQPPSTPALTCSPLTVLSSQVVTCTASGSTDPEGGAVTYAFSASGLQSVSGATATYAWGGSGEAEVSVTAADPQGASSAKAAQLITIQNRAPSTPTVTCSPLAADVGQTVSCSASGSTDPEGQAVTYTWSADGRSGAATGSSSTYAWSAAGTKTVTVTASDPSAASSSASATVTVTAAWAPTAIANLAVWLRADSLVTLSGGTVSSWGNIAGSAGAVNAVRGGNSVGPAPTTLGGRPAFQFTPSTGQGNLLLYTTSAIAGAPNVTVFFVGSADPCSCTATPLEAYSIFDETYDTRGWYFSWTNASHLYALMNRTADPYAGEVAQWSLGHVNAGSGPAVGALRAGALGTTLWYNGTSSVKSTEVWDPSPTVAMSIGSLESDFYPTQDPFRGKIAEILLYTRQLTAAEMDAVHQYFATRYGLTVARIASVP